MKLILPDGFDEHNFIGLSKKESNPRTRVRLIGMSILQEKRHLGKVANSIGVGAKTVGEWLKRFKEDGLRGLRDKHRSGRKKKLSDEEEDKFINSVKEAQATRSGGRIVAEDIQKILSDNYSKTYSLSGVYSLLHRLNFSWITARSVHPKANFKAQDDFKKNLI